MGKGVRVMKSNLSEYLITGAIDIDRRGSVKDADADLSHCSKCFELCNVATIVQGKWDI